MENHQRKINIFIPIEIIKRELLSKVILAYFIINNNQNIKTRCYIGSKSQIKKLISFKKSYGGIFIYKGSLSEYHAIKLKKKVEKFIILDEELGPTTIQFLGNAMNSRLWPGTEKYIDRFYLIGKKACDVGRKVYPKLDKKIRMTGWPRVDLWRPEFNYLYKNSIKDLKKNYGNFILFSSDFTFTSIERIKYEEEFWKNTKWEEKYKLNRAKKVFLEFQENLKLIRQLDARTDLPQIIIRPHPSDDLLAWKKISKSLKRIKIVFKGEVSSWVYASNGVLHRGCTSAIEAYMAGIQTGYIVTNNNWLRKSLPFKVSQHLYGLNEIVEFCKNNINKNLLPPKDYIEEFKNSIHIVKDKYACEIIAEDMLKDSITEKSCKLSFFEKKLDDFKIIIIKIKSFIIRLAKKYNSGVMMPNKMEGGINKKNISEILKNFKKDHNLKFKEVLKDCVEIE